MSVRQSVTGAVRQRSQLSQANGSDGIVEVQRISITRVGSEIDNELLEDQENPSSC